MFRPLAQFGRIAALASLAMMLAIQGLHSPLHHLHGTAHGHVHAVCCHHTHAGHTHYHQHETPADEDSPSDSHDCPLCQFLAQPAQLLSLPVVLEGHVLVVTLIAEHDVAAPALEWSSPHVRGPPLA